MVPLPPRRDNRDRPEPGAVTPLAAPLLGGLARLHIGSEVAIVLIVFRPFWVGLSNIPIKRVARTGRFVFCCTTVALARNRPPLTSSPIRIFTTSQPRNLLSMARSNRAQSRNRPSRSSQNRIAHTCWASARVSPPPYGRRSKADAPAPLGRTPNVPLFPPCAWIGRPRCAPKESCLGHWRRS